MLNWSVIWIVNTYCKDHTFQNRDKTSNVEHVFECDLRFLICNLALHFMYRYSFIGFCVMFVVLFRLFLCLLCVCLYCLWSNDYYYKQTAQRTERCVLYHERTLPVGASKDRAWWRRRQQASFQQQWSTLRHSVSTIVRAASGLLGGASHAILKNRNVTHNCVIHDGYVVFCDSFRQNTGNCHTDERTGFVKQHRAAHV